MPAMLAWENIRHATTGFPTKWRLRNERRNSILMTRHYPDLGSASDWLKQISHVVWPIRSHIISVEFLHSFLRRHFTGKPVVVSQSVSCFLRLLNCHAGYPYLGTASNNNWRAICKEIPSKKEMSCSMKLFNWGVGGMIANRAYW